MTNQIVIKKIQTENFNVKQMEDFKKKLTGKTQKIYYPWERKNLYRVIRNDKDGYFIKYKNKRLEIIPETNCLNEVIGIMAFHGRR